MADYTLTTQQVRESWAEYRTGTASRRPMHREDFDRWFAEEIRKAKYVAFEEGAYQAESDLEEGLATFTNPYRKEFP